MEFKQWLIIKIEERGTNPTALAEAIQENQSTIQRIITGETKNPRLKIIRKLEDYFSEKSTDRSQLDDRSSDITISQYLDVKGAMGVGILLRDQPGQITGFKVNAEWMNKNVPSNTGKDNLAVVTGFGDSMRGMFNSGDPLLIDTGVRSLDYDGVYFFRVGNEGFIKRLQRIPGDGIRAISTNKEYESWTITKDMDFEVFGRVLKVWNSEDF
jgi:phage repressor protein C with HTH and peptisase S24 domain